MNAHEQPFTRANEVMQATQTEPGGDSADQADRLAMIMEAEAIQAALQGETGEGSLDGYSYPLEDTEEVLSMEEAEDGSNDPRHTGEATRWQTAEESAIHVIGTKVERPVLTPEDETLLGIDPYDD
ncbi:MAG: hypothetical protein Q8L05_11200 [Actinomycetota bacterium]|nr:hypothetical protein [Actinomycetota bacterium]MDP2288749.1 hypothetical protein [Actinomycetota bacterium]